MGCARRRICCSVRSEGRQGKEARRVPAACDFVVLCVQGQRGCRQESVGVHAG